MSDFLERLERQDKTLTSKTVCWCGWDEPGSYLSYPRLAQALMVNSTLTELMLVDPTHLPSHSMAQDFRASEATAQHLASALQHNTTLTRLSLPRHEIHHTVGDFGTAGAIAIGLALQVAPRTSFDFELVGLDLSCAWQKLKLPREAETWGNGRIIDHMFMVYAERSVAFAMGCHDRLGQSSPLYILNDECMRSCVSACWGMEDPPSCIEIDQENESKEEITSSDASGADTDQASATVSTSCQSQCQVELEL